jgi:hypothetical protein
MSDVTSSQTVSRPGSLMTIDAERCPTCNEDRFIVLRGNRVACPTCCSTIRRGELYVPAENPRFLRTRHSTIFIVVVITSGLVALWTNGLLTLRW